MTTGFYQPEVVPPNRSWWRKYWYMILFGLAVSLLTLAYILRLATPPTPPENQAVWNSVVPGFTTVDQVGEKFGPPLEIENTPDGQALTYTSAFPADPHQVIIDSQGVVRFMKEYTPYQSDHVLQQYIDQYGQPDLTLFTPEIGESLRAFVFLKSGLVVIAHNRALTVEQKWYFQPVSAEVFLSSWGESLSQVEPAPERFVQP